MFIKIFLNLIFLSSLVLCLLLPQKILAAVPTGFQEQTMISGLTNPMAVRFSSDGRIFVAEKSGVIKVFDSLTDPTPDIFADLRTNVHNFWDRGLLGMTLDPNFPTKPYVYVLYTYDAAIGQSAPKWGSTGQTSDGCPNPPGATTDGCVVSGRLSRLQVSGNTMVGNEQVLVEDWCQQYPSHSVGSLVFGADGALYASGGEGASFTTSDYGQFGNPKNPCGDPPGGVGGNQTIPTAEGGSLRSQDLQTSGDPVGLNGSIIRINPDTGEAMPDNPLLGNSDTNAKKIIAYGLRNPFRLAMTPGTNELWIADVGANGWEEIDRISNPTDGIVKNFGWPCYEGGGRNSGFEGLNLNICKNLYNQSNVVNNPFYAYSHSNQVVPGESCATGSSSISGIIAGFKNTNYPAEYNDALFFSDYSRNCIWVMFKGANGQLDPNSIQTFVSQAQGPVDLQTSPEGEVYYVDFNNGIVRRIKYNGNAPAICTNSQFTATYFNNLSLSGTPNFTQCEDTINNDWGMGGIGNGVNIDNFSARWVAKPTFQAGNYTFSTTADDGVRMYIDGLLVIDKWIDQGATTYQYTQDLTAGEHEIKLEFYDSGWDAVAKLSWIQNGNVNTPPVVTINSPVVLTTWKVGDVINFSGSAFDLEDGPLAAVDLSWSLIMQHCPSNCHSHTVQDFNGVDAGSFTAPDHEYPSYLELKLSAKDSQGLVATKTVKLDPQVVKLTFQSTPISGLELLLGTQSSTTQFSRDVIINSLLSVNAPSPQTINGKSYEFVSWSDGGLQSHSITTGLSPVTYTATYKEQTVSASNGLNATYFDNMNFSGLSVSKVDQTVDFNWGAVKPDPLIGQDTFSVRWSGQIQPQYSENYTFYTTSDDGVRLWINNQLIIDKWIDQSATQWTGSINLVAGQKYDIKMEFYDNGWDAVARLFWSSASTPKQIIPASRLFTTVTPPPVGTGDGLTATYFDNKDLTNLKVTRLDQTVDFNWGGGSPASTIGADTFSVRWTGFVTPVVTGNYNFYTQSDDGVRLWINNQQLINQWNDHSSREDTGTISLTAGVKYPIKMEFYDNGWDAVAKLLWSGPSVTKQIIPKANLYSQ